MLYRHANLQSKHGTGITLVSERKFLEWKDQSIQAVYKICIYILQHKLTAQYRNEERYRNTTLYSSLIELNSCIALACTMQFYNLQRKLENNVHQECKLLRLVFPVKAKFHYAIQLANQLASWFASWSVTC